MAIGTNFKRGAMPIIFVATGAMSVRTGKQKVQLTGSGKIIAVKAWLDTAPTGTTTFKVDINKNETTIYGTQANRPTWVASAQAATVGVHSVTTYVDGDRISWDIDAVGNTVAGSDISVTIWVLPTGD
jgi:hypothetical protein